MSKILEHTVNQSDPGDDTLRRYRYQCTYAAIISLGLLAEDSLLKKIYCEHHEDILVKLKSSKFIGIQVKTRNLDLGPLEAQDESILNSIKRFIKLDLAYADQFQNFVIATNVGFAKKDNAKGLPYIISQIRNDASITNTNIKKWIKKFASEASCTEEQVIIVLKKIRLRPDIGSIDSIEGTLFKALEDLKLLDSATLAELKVIIDKLIIHHINASSLKYKDPMSECLILANDPSKEEDYQTIKGKTILKEDLLAIIQETLTDEIKFYLKDKMPKKLTGTKRLELKLDAGGISYDNLELLKSSKASMEHKMAQWRHKYNDKTATERYNQIKAIVQSECQSSYDENVEIVDNQSKKPIAGTKMLIQLRKELKSRYNLDQGSFFDCIPEHLYGMAAILTEDCKVWWSEKFNLD